MQSSLRTLKASSVARARVGRKTLSVVASLPKSYKFYYFPLTGRGETTRLIFRVSGTPFEDVRMTQDDWAKIKPNTPFGQVPALEVDGRWLAQSTAIERYVARQTGLYPADTWEAARVDEAVAFAQEFLDIFAPTFSIKDQNEKLAARKALVEGPLKAKLESLTKLLERNPSGYIEGGHLTVADLSLFSLLSFLISGFFDGVPKDVLAKYPKVVDFHTRIANHPEIKKYYADTKDPMRLAYTPGAATGKF